MTLAAWVGALALAGVPEQPPIVAELSSSAEHGSVAVVLTGDSPRAHRVLAIDVWSHLDPTTTMLEPRLERGDGEVWSLFGYRLSQHEDPGDTLITYGLLLDVRPAGSRVLWWENRMEVPTSLFVGPAELVFDGRVVRLTADVIDPVSAERRHLEGLIRR